MAKQKRPGKTGAFSLQPIPAEDLLLSMISAQTLAFVARENRYALFRIMLP
jgi:hypothetical protein